MIINAGYHRNTIPAVISGYRGNLQEDSDGWSYTFFKTGGTVIIPTKDIVVDIFMVGGGGAGGAGSVYDFFEYENERDMFVVYGGGGGGGFFTNKYNHTLKRGNTYGFFIGTGGKAGSWRTATKPKYIPNENKDGGKTYMTENGSVVLFANGGSAGGDGGMYLPHDDQEYKRSFGAGGTGGASGGQGMTTEPYIYSQLDYMGRSQNTKAVKSYAFNDYKFNGILYGAGGGGASPLYGNYPENGGTTGGGDGGHYNHDVTGDAAYTLACGKNAQENTGSGGGGALTVSGKYGVPGNGADGIIIIRNARG